MATTNQLIGGAFQDAEGNVLANGFLLMKLSQDGVVNSDIEVGSELVIKILLDVNGAISTATAQSVWPNDVITPANTFYSVTAYTANGQLVWGRSTQYVHSAPSPFNISAWTA